MKAIKETKLKEIFQRLSIDNKVKSQADLGRQIKVASTSITHIIQGSKKMSLRMIKNLHKVFEINANYLISDDFDMPFYVKEMYSVNQIENKAKEDSMRSRIDALEREIQDLKQRMHDKDKIIQLLERGKS